MPPYGSSILWADAIWPTSAQTKVGTCNVVVEAPVVFTNQSLPSSIKAKTIRLFSSQTLLDLSSLFLEASPCCIIGRSVKKTNKQEELNKQELKSAMVHAFLFFNDRNDQTRRKSDETKKKSSKSTDV
jgi:hypothetical protein